MKCPGLRDLPAAPGGRTGWPWTEDSDSARWLAKRGDWPRVLIVMPSFNQGEFIEESIRSVLLQGYPDLEFYIYDAASTDASAEIISKYAPWLTYWVSEKDDGQSAAINQGLRKGSGKYFNWQNSDDVLAPDSLFIAVNALLEHPEASHVHGYRKVIYADGSPHSSSENAYGPPTRLVPDVATSISTLKTGTQPGGLMDRDLVLKVGGIDETMHFAMDMDILLKLSVIKPPLYVHEELVSYRFHENTKTHGAWTDERRHEKLDIVENLFDMPEAAPYMKCRKEAMATGHRYAAECATMAGSPWIALYHRFMDAMWAPFSGWDRRRASVYFLKQRSKGVKMGATTDGEEI